MSKASVPQYLCLNWSVNRSSDHGILINNSSLLLSYPHTPQPSVDTQTHTNKYTLGYVTRWAFPGGTSGKEPTCQCRNLKGCGFDPCIWKIPWRRAWQPTPVFLPGEFHGYRSLAGYNPCRPKESDTSEKLCACMHVHTHTQTHTHTHTHTQSFGKSTEIMSNSKKKRIKPRG